MSLRRVASRPNFKPTRLLHRDIVYPMETMFSPPDRLSDCAGTPIITSCAPISLRLHRIAQS
jgi:hypothetical protein